MAITINTNVTSLVAQRNLNSAQGKLNQSMERLSSGLAINRAKDNAAGLAISKRIDRQVTGFNQGIKNGNNGISVIQNTEANFEEVNNSLQRLRELAMQASSETYSSSDRDAMQLEYTTLVAEIDRIALTAEFNGFKLADGSQSSLSIQVGANNTSNDRISIGLTNLQVSGSALNISGTSVSTASAAQAALDSLDTAIDTVNASRAQLGADQVRVETAVNNNINTVESLSAARSTIMDVDFASEVSVMTKYNVLSQAGSAMLSQANSIPQMALSLLQ